MSTTYIDRTNTNQEYRRANLEMGEGANGIIRPSSDILRDKRRKLLGHIIRRLDTRNTKQRLQQERSFHNKLNTEGWDAQEQRGHMKP